MVPKRGVGTLQVIENMVARDGVEPPTPAFSGLASPTVNLLILLYIPRKIHSKNLVLL